MPAPKCDCGNKFYGKACHRACASNEPTEAEIASLMALFAGPAPTASVRKVSKPVLGFARSAL